MPFCPYAARALGRRERLHNAAVPRRYIRKVGEDDVAALLYNRALDIQPGNVDALVSLGRIETRAGETETAEQHLSDAIAADDQSAAALVALANLARKKGDGVAAVEYLKRAADAAPEAVEPRVFLARYQFDHGELELALEATNAALEIDSRHKDATLL